MSPTPDALQRIAGTHGSVLASWVKLPAVESVEILASAGLDAVVIDLEHSMIDLQTASAQITLARALGIAPLVRVPGLAGGLVQRVLDAGAAGIVLPHVDDARAAAALVHAVRFPPVGARGAGWTSRAGAWGAARDAYLAGGSEVLAIAQIESGRAVGSIGEIVATEGIDAILIGEADLGLDLASQPRDALQDAVLTARAAADAVGMPVGTAVAGDRDAIRTAAAAGYRLIVAGNDATLLHGAAGSLVHDA